MLCGFLSSRKKTENLRNRKITCDYKWNVHWSTNSFIHSGVPQSYGHIFEAWYPATFLKHLEIYECMIMRINVRNWACAATLKTYLEYNTSRKVTTPFQYHLKYQINFHFMWKYCYRKKRFFIHRQWVSVSWCCFILRLMELLPYHSIRFTHLMHLCSYLRPPRGISHATWLLILHETKKMCVSYLTYKCKGAQTGVTEVYYKH